MNRRLSTALRIALRIAAILAIGVGLWWFIHKMDVATLATAFSDAKLWPLVAAAVLNMLCLLGKAIGWRLMLAPAHRVRILRLFRYTIATFAASAIAPARAGEVLRVWTLKRRDGVPVTYTTAVAVAEKLLDGMTILILVIPLPWLVPDLPSWLGDIIAGCAVFAAALFVALFIAVGRVRDDAPADRGRPLVRRFLTGLQVLRNPRRLASTFGVLFSVWVADLVMIAAVFYAVNIDLPVAGVILTMFTLNLTIALPSTPAQVGALEVGALAGLRLMHVDQEKALAFALLYHAAQVLPVVAAGLILELRLVLGREGAPTTANGAEPAPEPAPEPHITPLPTAQARTRSHTRP